MDSQQRPVADKSSKRRPLGVLLAIGGILVSVFVLLNLTFGIVELPDNLPLVGNLDETLAAAVLFSCLRYLGVDVIPFADRAKGSR